MDNRYNAYNTESQEMLTWEDIKEPIIHHGELVRCLGDVLNEEYPFVPLKYTGKDDIEGNPIVQGDVVRVEGHPFQRKEGESAGIHIDGDYLVHWNEEAVGFSIGMWKFAEVCYHCKVIGNIYENPELLKGETA